MKLPQTSRPAELSAEPRSVTRYRNFEPETVKIHPLKRAAAGVAERLPLTWRFPVLGLPPRADIPGEVDTSGAALQPFFRLPGGIACQLGAHLDREGAYVPHLTLGAGPFIETRFVQRQRLFPKVRRLAGTVLSLVAEGHVNYYRWLMETLPRLRYVWENQVHFDWLYCCQEQPYHRESIRHLRFDPSRVIPCDENRFVRGDELIVPAYVEESEPWVLPWLREQFLPPAAARVDKPRRRLYVTRSRATGRRIENEAAVLEQLVPRGFTCVALEDLSFFDQVSLFQSAEMVVGSHGAGLANLVFCEPGALVLELIADDYPFSYYPEISRRLQLKHHRVSCLPLRPEHVRMSDLLAPVEQITRLIDGAMSGS